MYINDSQEEDLVEFWLEELVKEGYAKRYGRLNKGLKLSDKLIDKVTKLNKTARSNPYTILEAHSYRPDFVIIWSEKAHKIFYLMLDKKYPFFDKREYLLATNKKIEGKEEIISVLEVKPFFDQNNMTRLFKMNQKWVYVKHKIFVNLIIPTLFNKPKINLFQKTFTPRFVIDNFVYKRKTKKNNKGDSKIKYKYRTLKQFVDGKINK